MPQRGGVAGVVWLVAVLLLGGCLRLPGEAAEPEVRLEPAAEVSTALGAGGAARAAPSETVASALGPVVPPEFVVVAPEATEPPVLSPTVPPIPTPDPYLVIGPPVHVEIPSIGVSASIELVGLTSDHAMDVPRGWMNVGWYRDGYRPGEPGNAVLAGHLDDSSGGPAVFWSLDRVQIGDEIVVDYANGDRYVFVVEGQELYEHDAVGPIIDRIFGDSLTADLNLVTCDGAWDHGQATYSHRLVVFSTLSPEKTVRTGTTGRAPVQ